MNVFFAQIILNNADEASQLTSQAWNSLWEDALNGGLYTSINNLGSLFAVGCLVLWAYGWMRSWFGEDSPSKPYTEIIWPLIVAILLSNGGSQMRAATLTIRNVGNGVNNAMLRSVSANIDFEKTLKDLANYRSTQATINELRAACDRFVDNTKLAQCLEQQRVKAEEALATARSESNDSGLLARLGENIRNNFGNPLQAAGTLQRAIESPMMLVVEAFMIGMQVAFQSIIEVSLLLTALMGPIAVGTTLLPIGGKPIYLWLTSTWSLTLAKIALNIVTGLVAVSIQRSGDYDTLGTSITLGLLSPILALAIVGGGGLAIFNAITAAATAPLRLVPGLFK
jgi:hypothetical protein